MGLILDKLPGVLEPFPGGSFVVSRIDDVINWGRKNSLWPLTFGTSCCAIEMMMASGASRHDLARFGAEVVRPSPRQADLFIVAGTITKRMAPRMRVLYEQMGEPRWVIATGACAISGGPFMYHSYTTIRGVDEIVPVDVFVPGCPPRPEALFHAILTLQKMIVAGESTRNPTGRKRPVTISLPPGITKEDLQEDMEKTLMKDGDVDILAEAKVKHWADKLDNRL